MVIDTVINVLLLSFSEDQPIQRERLRAGCYHLANVNSECVPAQNAVMNKLTFPMFAFLVQQEHALNSDVDKYVEELSDFVMSVMVIDENGYYDMPTMVGPDGQVSPNQYSAFLAHYALEFSKGFENLC